MEQFTTARLAARDWTAADLDAAFGNARSLAVCRRLGMTHRGQTTAYYGETLELFELSRAAVQ